MRKISLLTFILAMGVSGVANALDTDVRYYGMPEYQIEDAKKISFLMKIIQTIKIDKIENKKESV